MTFASNVSTVLRSSCAFHFLRYTWRTVPLA